MPRYPAAALLALQEELTLLSEVLREQRADAVRHGEELARLRHALKHLPQHRTSLYEQLVPLRRQMAQFNQRQQLMYRRRRRLQQRMTYLQQRLLALSLTITQPPPDPA